MTAALVLLAALQGPALDVTAGVDRARVVVGDEVLYTLRAVGRSTAAFRAEITGLDGLAVLDRRERTDVVYVGREARRAYTLEVRLRAEQAGSWRVGPVRVEQGDLSAFAPAVSVTITPGSGGGGSGGLTATVLALAQRAPPPRVGRVSVAIVVSSDDVWAGEQLDVLTVAWFPRGLRMRLRQPPTMRSPSLDGVWAVPQGAVPGVVATRVLDGETYDLFVGHQVVFPLTPGVLTVPAARVTYTQPPARGEERRVVIESDPVRVAVRRLPTLGRPAGFDGPVAGEVRVSYRVGQSAARAGALIPIEVRVAGEGNLALWPAPAVEWPPAARFYTEGVEEAPRAGGGRQGGTKTYRFLLLPDSAGSLPLPPIVYPYFDPGSGSYREARSDGFVLPVLEPAAPADRRIAPPLVAAFTSGPATRLFRLPAAVIGSLVAAPVLLAAGGLLLGRRRPVRRRETPDDPAGRLEALVLGRAPRGAHASPATLTAGLRRAGIDRELARRLVDLHLAVEHELYAPGGAGLARPELLHAITAALALVRATPPTVGTLLLCLLMVSATPLIGQSPADLYARRVYPAAADGFRAAAAVSPADPAVWYDLAAAEYMARRDAHAAAALLRAAALAPRSPRVVALWRTLEREHEPLRRAGPRPPVNAVELGAGGLVGLWLGGLLVALGRGRLRRLAMVVLALAVLLSGAGLLLHRAQRSPRGLLAGGAALRMSPHGLASEQGTASPYALVALERREGGWWLIRTHDGTRGWVPQEIIAPVRGLD